VPLIGHQPSNVFDITSILALPPCPASHCRWLLDTGQEEKAGLVKEREGDYLGAIALYLKGGLPARAAQVGPHYLIGCTDFAGSTARHVTDDVELLWPEQSCMHERDA
jgi:hypothetical protein